VLARRFRGGSAGPLTAVAAQAAFVAAFADVVLPITLTSLTNLCMFAILATAALPAVSLTAVTAVLAVFLLYATVLTSFAAAMALDFQRQVHQRRDVLCCAKVEAAPPPRPEAAPTAALKRALWVGLYRPLLRSKPGRGAVVAAAALLLALASVGLANAKLGLGLTEFFPQGSQVRPRARTRATFVSRNTW
jgi:predicted RND superfamily exporter protein